MLIGWLLAWSKTAIDINHGIEQCTDGILVWEIASVTVTDGNSVLPDAMNRSKKQDIFAKFCRIFMY